MNHFDIIFVTSWAECAEAAARWLIWEVAPKLFWDIHGTLPSACLHSSVHSKSAAGQESSSMDTQSPHHQSPWGVLCNPPRSQTGGHFSYNQQTPLESWPSQRRKSGDTPTTRDLLLALQSHTERSLKAYTRSVLLTTEYKFLRSKGDHPNECDIIMPNKLVKANRIEDIAMNIFKSLPSYEYAIKSKCPSKEVHNQANWLHQWQRSWQREWAYLREFLHRATHKAVFKATCLSTSLSEEPLPWAHFSKGPKPQPGWAADLLNSTCDSLFYQSFSRLTIISSRQSVSRLSFFTEFFRHGPGSMSLPCTPAHFSLKLNQYPKSSWELGGHEHHLRLRGQLWGRGLCDEETNFNPRAMPGSDNEDDNEDTDQREMPMAKDEPDVIDPSENSPVLHGHCQWNSLNLWVFLFLALFFKVKQLQICNIGTLANNIFCRIWTLAQ